MARVSTAVPRELARRESLVVRPMDAAGVFTYPSLGFSRLVEKGAAVRIVHGYYALVPEEHLKQDPPWVPPLDAAALGIAQSDYGRDSAVLMGISAARHHGAFPPAGAEDENAPGAPHPGSRAAVVAVPYQRPILETAVGRMIFVTRNLETIDVEQCESELGGGWVTTPEQTMLDLAARPKLRGLSDAGVPDAIRALYGRADLDWLERFARDTHRPAALRAVKAAVAKAASDRL